MTEKSGPLTPGVSREVVTRDPSTNAGRAFFSRLWAVNDYAGASQVIATSQTDIAAIEEEARRLALAQGLDVERLARALHGTGLDLDAEPWTWGSCTNWEPGWGDECGPDKHLDEARNLLRRLSEEARKP